MHSARELAQSSAEISVNICGQQVVLNKPRRHTAGFHENRLENQDCFISEDGPTSRGEAGM